MCITRVGIRPGRKGAEFISNIQTYKHSTLYISTEDADRSGKRLYHGFGYGPYRYMTLSGQRVDDIATCQ